jgi:ABC-2 type transport system ATP-binding protein
VKEQRARHTDLPAVEAHGITKSFGTLRAVDGLDLTIPSGCVYGILGPNGAGKTTMIRILATLTRPDAGVARVLGHDVVGEAGAAAFDLADASRRQAAQLSGGMRRRLDIAASLIVRPELLFLDEPTTGLDPRSRNQVWRIVRAIVAAGTTVVLTTQYLDEADQLADRIAVIDHGRVIAEGTRGQLKASAGAGSVRVRLADPDQRNQAETVLSAALGVPAHPDPDPATLRAQILRHDSDTEPSRRAADALAELCRAGIQISDFTVGQPTLDEVFLALTAARPRPGTRPAEAIA